MTGKRPAGEKILENMFAWEHIGQGNLTPPLTHPAERAMTERLAFTNAYTPEEYARLKASLRNGGSVAWS